uniref:NB-ARC domain-containing protein n=1 Tax=Physcomitrium patens TaxID=3218 RepID=A0A7I4C2G4_PHYPA
MNEDTSLKLFITHFYGYQDKFSNKFDDIGKYIVKACNGLSLNLKVMDVILSRQKRRSDLDGYKNNSDYKILNILKISFNSLMKVEEKNMF